MISLQTAIPEENYRIKKPVFLGAATKDYICVAAAQMMNAQKFCPQLTAKQYDGDHWIMWSHADQLNSDLLAWLESLPDGKATL
jgi:soluble epoxide hydrolase/lipid-phosphate phosphatase